MADVAKAIGDRRLAGLYRYWDERRGGREMPSRADIEPTDIPRLLPILILVDVEPDGGLRYRLIGTEFVTVAGRDVTGRSYAEVFPPGPYRDYIFALYDELILRRLPIYTEGVSPIAGSSRRRYTRRLMLPLSADGVRIDMVLGVQIFEMTSDPDRVALQDGSEPYVETMRRVLDPASP